MKSPFFFVRPPWGMVILLAFLAASCGNRLPSRISMDPNPVFTGGIGWIVVAEAYARVKAQPNPEAPDIGHLRSGDMLPVLGRERLPPSNATWYKVQAGSREGWMQSSQVSFFQTRETAERAAAQYR